VNTKNDKVSVIIPVYNSKSFLQSSIESAIGQTYDNLEIIAVDDGSTDSSVEILEQYSDKIMLVRQENKGLANALNNGIKKMSGKWLKWLSPDDILFPDSIETLINASTKLSKNTIVYSNWEIIDELGQNLRNFVESDYNKLENFEFNVRLLDDQHINVNTSIVPSSLFERGCLFQNLNDSVVVDYDFFLRAGILFDTSFHLVKKTLLKYRIHTDQLSHKKISKTLKSREYVRKEILSKLGGIEKERYLNALNKYKKTKPLHKKTMEMGLRLATISLPDWVTNRMLIFYLNKIRSSR